MFTKELGSGLPLAIVVLAYVTFFGSYALLARWLIAITPLSRAEVENVIVWGIRRLAILRFLRVKISRVEKGYKIKKETNLHRRQAFPRCSVPWIVWSGVGLFAITRIYRSAVGGRKLYREWEERGKEGQMKEERSEREYMNRTRRGKEGMLANEHNMSVLT